MANKEPFAKDYRAQKRIITEAAFRSSSGLYKVLIDKLISEPPSSNLNMSPKVFALHLASNVCRLECRIRDLGSIPKP